MQPPDVVGLPLPDALARLAEYGVVCHVTETQAPQKRRPCGTPRVLRQRHGKDGAVYLVVAMASGEPVIGEP